MERSAFFACLCLPLAALQISEAKFSALGALGAGLLTGTALAVILPEGFHAFQAAQNATGLPCTSLKHIHPDGYSYCPANRGEMSASSLLVPSSNWALHLPVAAHAIFPHAHHLEQRNVLLHLYAA